MSGKIIVGDGRSVGGRKSSNGFSDIPSGSRKMVQSLKEIVNCPEAEIYAVLKDCNMDPNEAVSRLLSQDPFHEVKSKKDKKKEIRDIPDSRPRGYSNTYNRGIRGGSDRYTGRSGGGATPFTASEPGSFQGKTTNKRESGMQTYAGSYSSTSGVSSHHQISHSASTTRVVPLMTLALLKWNQHQHSVLLVFRRMLFLCRDASFLVPSHIFGREMSSFLKTSSAGYSSAILSELTCGTTNPIVEALSNESDFASFVCFSWKYFLLTV